MVKLPLSKGGGKEGNYLVCHYSKFYLHHKILKTFNCICEILISVTTIFLTWQKYTPIRLILNYGNNPDKLRTNKK